MNTSDTNTSNSSKLALFPDTKMVIFDADTFDSICVLLEDMKTYIKKTGARVKYTQPEQFATVCQTYCNRIEKELEKGKQFTKTLKEYQPVKRGHWVYDGCGNLICSNCRWKFSDELPYMSRNLDAKTEEIIGYCMHCGAKMDLKG